MMNAEQVSKTIEIAKQLAAGVGITQDTAKAQILSAMIAAAAAVDLVKLTQDVLKAAADDI